MKNIIRRAAVSLLTALTVISAASSVTASAYAFEENPTIPDHRLLERVEDYADLLSDKEEQMLLDTCNEISERQQVDVVIVTTGSLGERTSEQFADDYFDYNGFGQGSDYTGIVLLVSIEDRDWAISTHGSSVGYFTDAGQEYMVGQFRPFLSDGKYYKAFDSYAKLCDDFITRGKTGESYDSGYLPKHSAVPFSYVFWGKFWKTLLICFGASMIIMLIFCSVEEGSLKSVEAKKEADNFIREGSLNINERSDTFLYKDTKKRYNPPSESSGSSRSGGSSTHTSSSGRSHGGSSGKF